jgi:hypothetical protein
MGISDVPVPVRSNLVLNAHPNPFNPRTWIHFDLPKSGQVSLEVLDLRGRRVAQLDQGWFEEGSHEVLFLGQGDRGEALASGVYLVRMNTSVGAVSTKITLTR